ncbi:hypothetical protein ALQ63_02075 [Serratia plymuthica]|nr:hypothetical protein ALQ63_02075 [Serratia plymuthica]
MRKKRRKALFSVLVGRAGLIRPLASPYGPTQALFKIVRANFVEPAQVLIRHDAVRYVAELFGIITVAQMRKKRRKALSSVLVGRAGFEPATN